jgi:hypothetical protein
MRQSQTIVARSSAHDSTHSSSACVYTSKENENRKIPARRLGNGGFVKSPIKILRHQRQLEPLPPTHNHIPSIAADARCVRALAPPRRKADGEASTPCGREASDPVDELDTREYSRLRLIGRAGAKRHMTFVQGSQLWIIIHSSVGRECRHVPRGME